MHSSIDLIACHLESELLTFPGGRISTHDEGERARFGAGGCADARRRARRRARMQAGAMDAELLAAELRRVGG
jgi:hypothetical protein